MEELATKWKEKNWESLYTILEDRIFPKDTNLFLRFSLIVILTVATLMVIPQLNPSFELKSSPSFSLEGNYTYGSQKGNIQISCRPARESGKIVVGRDAFTCKEEVTPKLPVNELNEREALIDFEFLKEVFLPFWRI